MNLAHLHLLLNHFPTIGMIIGLGLYLLALLSKSVDLKKASLSVFLLLALIALPTYVTGNAAEDRLGDRPEVFREAIPAHQSMALLGLILLELTGLFAWIALWSHRRKSAFAGWQLMGVLVLALATFGVMAQAARIGGLINHPELRSASETPPAAIGPLTDAAVQAFVLTDHPDTWIAGETIHFIGLALLFGVVLVVDLRMLGMMKAIPFETLHRLLPWAVAAFAFNVATGMMFFVAQSGQYIRNGVLYWKLAFVLLAGLNALYFTVLDEPWQLRAGQEASGRAKAAAFTAIVVWIGVIYCGDMLPFIGGAF